MLSYTKAVGTSRLAASFVDAAKRQPLDEQPQPFVTYFLLGHALELAWKSVLISEGVSDGELRAIGHDLRKAKVRAEALIGSAHARQQHVDEVTEMIADQYEGKAFEYLETGYYSLPPAAEAVPAVEAYTRSVSHTVNDRVRLRLGRGDPSG